MERIQLALLAPQPTLHNLRFLRFRQQIHKDKSTLQLLRFLHDHFHRHEPKTLHPKRSSQPHKQYNTPTTFPLINDSPYLQR